MNPLALFKTKHTFMTDIAEGGPENYFLPRDYTERSAPQYFEDAMPQQWQPDVYRLADKLGARIIDIGCGQGGKLKELSKRHEVIGVDFGVNIAKCKTHNFGQWYEHDLNEPGDLPLPGAAFNGAVVICADVIEHLVDPMPLLRKLKRATELGAVVVLSTPERALVYGASHRGPPPNTAHVREWSLGELRRLLEHVGFEVLYMGITADNDTDRRMVTSLAVLTT